MIELFKVDSRFGDHAQRAQAKTFVSVVDAQDHLQEERLLSSNGSAHMERKGT